MTIAGIKPPFMMTGPIMIAKIATHTPSIQRRGKSTTAWLASGKRISQTIKLGLPTKAKIVATSVN